MANKDEYGRLVFDCVANGIRQNFPAPEAYQRLHGDDIGWILRYLWVRDRVLGKEQNRKLSAKNRSGALFGFALLSLRRGTPLIFEPRIFPGEHERGLSRNAFNGRARRFAEIFDEEIKMAQRPFEFIAIPADRGRTLPAYRMKDNISWFIILGVAGESNEDVDWESFTKPPAR